MKKIQLLAAAVFLGLGTMPLSQANSTSSSDVGQASVKVRVNPATGHTIEQDNVIGRLKGDNQPGAVKHLYVISPDSGQVILYSTVRGKVTSGGKRLTPLSTISKYSCGKDSTCYEGQRVIVGDVSVLTTEIVQDDGTYGSSVPYIYWLDSKGRYHQHFFTEGQIIRDRKSTRLNSSH